MEEIAPQYSIDTNIFINSWTRDYPPDVVPALWDCFTDLIQSGRMHASDEVLSELKKKDDDVYAWCKERKNLWVPLDNATIQETQLILAEFPDFVKTGTGRNQADPFVIALARVNGYIVVTSEKGGSRRKPRIPFICTHFKVTCISLIEMAKLEKWVFTRR